MRDAHPLGQAELPVPHPREEDQTPRLVQQLTRAHGDLSRDPFSATPKPVVPGSAPPCPASIQMYIARPHEGATRPRSRPWRTVQEACQHENRSDIDLGA